MSNPFSKLLELLPTTRVFYGTIESITGDLITVILVGGGSVSFRNAQYARTFTQGNSVWLENLSGAFVMTQAPSFQTYALMV